VKGRGGDVVREGEIIPRQLPSVMLRVLGCELAGGAAEKAPPLVLTIGRPPAWAVVMPMRSCIA